MKKILLLLCLGIAYTSTAQQITVSPENFNESDEITLTLSGIDVDAQWGTSEVYLWAWFYNVNDDFIGNSPETGSDFGNSPETAKWTNNGDGTYSYTLTPTTFYNASGIEKMGVLAKSQDGSNQTSDLLIQVGKFDLTVTSPSLNQATSVNAGNTIAIEANSSVSTDFELFANGSSVNTQTGVTNYSYTYTVNQNTDFKLIATQTGTTNQTAPTFTVFANATPSEAAVPPGMKNGFNYDPNTPDEATFVLYAPDKEFVHLIGNFNDNDWSIESNYLLNKDSATDRHWITVDLSGNTNSDLLYQYVVEYDINVADPYSTMVLDSFNDQYIEEEVFANIPAYPSTKTTEMVSWVDLDEENYAWLNNDFTPPAKEDLVIYEVLLRDFSDEHSYASLIERLDYLEELGINAIELMPVQEFDGNISWGYNPAFHMALDKYYGTRNAFKSLIDACHARGMAVIVDVVYNHATGQNPYVRMYNTNGQSSGTPTADSPFFNTSATHSYSVFNDFDHSSAATRDYVEQTASYWINEFKIDGFRWDLTKGFTQNCAGSETCTNNYNADRVAILKEYADMQWELDEDFYVIFEHLGNGGSLDEEKEWAAYRADEGKGIMLWNKQTEPYNEATMGYPNANINGVSYQVRGFNSPKTVSYMESHDEERLMYKNIAFGNSDNPNHDVKDLEVALARMEAAGAFFFTVPGPKMIWQFGELGYDVSIFTCEDGTVPTPYGTDNCKLSPKPDGWDYLSDSNRTAIYDTWSKLIALKKNEPIFKTEDFTIDAANTNGLKTIHLSDPTATGDAIQYVTIIGNFGVTTQNIDPSFQETGTWYNVLDNTEYQVDNVNEEISLSPGAFRVYANQSASLATSDLLNDSLKFYPNPTQGFIQFNKTIDQLTIYDLTGKKVFAQNTPIDQNSQVNISSLQTGVYILKITLNGLDNTLKLIIR